MSLLVGNAAEQRMLELILNVVPQEGLRLKLFRNDRVPADDDTEGDYVELLGHGYAPIDLDEGDWSFTLGNPTVALQPQRIFSLTPGAPVTVYGYFVVWWPSGKLAWAERLGTPQPVETLDVDIKVTPRFTMNKAA